MNTKRFALFGVASLAVVAAAGFAMKPAFSKTMAECDHSGNHYTEKAATANTAGTKEYWVCCSCHEHFFTQPAAGTWANAGVAAAVEADDDRYIAPLWKAVGGTATYTDVEGGVEVAGIAGYGQRVYYTQKVALDGLSFTFGTKGLADQLGDCRGFYLHGGEGANYFSEETSLTFTIWSLYGQNRGFFGHDHDYNDTPKCYKDTTGTITGMSTAGGMLVMNFMADPEIKFTFEAEGSDWYKVTMEYAQVWGSPNYNATSGVGAYTYVKKADINPDADGKVWFSAFGLGTHETTTSDVFSVKGL